MKKYKKKIRLLGFLVIFGLIPGLTLAQEPDPSLMLLGDEIYPGPWMVQTSRTSVDPDFLTRIKAAGAQPLPIYLPDRTVLANIPDASVVDALLALQDPFGLPVVEALEPYHPYYKLDENIGFTPLTSEERTLARTSQQICEEVCTTQPTKKTKKIVDIQQTCTQDCYTTTAVFLLAVELFPGSDVGAAEIAVSQTGARLLQTLTSGTETRLHLKATKPQYEHIAFLPSVASIEEIPEISLHNNTATWAVQSGTLNSKPIWEQGLHGEGQIVGHIDDPIDFVSKFFACDSITDPGCNNAPGPEHRKIVGYDDNPIWQFTSELFNFTSRLFNVLPCAPDCSASDFTFADPLGNFRVLDPRAWSHGTHTAGIIAGDRSPFIGGNTNGNGHAYKAKLFHTDLEQLAAITGRDYIDPYGSDPLRLSLYEAFQHAYDAGARVFSNSWGLNFDSVVGHGSYSYWSKDADKFAYDHEDALIIFSGSNFNFTTSPENAKNVLTVGPSHNGANAHLVYKNQDGIPHAGPTFDGRRKPEIFAPGADDDGIEGGFEGIVSAQSNPGEDNIGTTKWDGSSMAAAAIAGGAALARQYFTEGWYPSGTPDLPNAMFTSPSGALLKAVLLNSTVNMEGPEYPSNAEGWGLLRLDEALYFTGDSRNLLVLYDEANANGLLSGQSRKTSVEVPVNSTEPLKITLVFTEPPALPSAAAATINNLDLRVTDPSGNIYLGNLFDAATGVSLLNPSGSPDAKNNVEMVLVNHSVGGIWEVEVFGADVNIGTQGFALVATGGNLEEYISLPGLAPTAIENTYTAIYQQDLDTASLGMPSLLANDYDPEGNLLTASITTQPGCGTVDLNPTDGHFVYHAQGCPLGPESFTYQAYDGLSLSDPSTVTMEIVNYSPVVSGGGETAYVISGGTILDTLADGKPPLLDYTFDFDNLHVSPDQKQPLTVAVVSEPSCGTLLDYNPQTGHFRFDGDRCGKKTSTMDFTVSDGVSVSSPRSIKIYNVASNAGTASGLDAYTTVRNQTIDTLAMGLPPLLANDLNDVGATLSASLFSATPLPCGTLHHLDPDTGHFVFEPSDECNSAGFVYTLTATWPDSSVHEETESVYILITWYNPVVADDYYHYVDGQRLDTVADSYPSVLANDRDEDPLPSPAVTITVPPSCGNLEMNWATGHFTFDPTGGPTACNTGQTVTFEYLFTDYDGKSDTGLVTLFP